MFLGSSAVMNKCSDCRKPAPGTRKRCTPCTLIRWDVAPKAPPPKLPKRARATVWPEFAISMFLGALK